MTILPDGITSRIAGYHLFRLSPDRELREMLNLDGDLVVLRIDGTAKGHTVDIHTLVQDFYTSMGWDAQGRPKTKTLRDLGLLDISGWEWRLRGA